VEAQQIRCRSTDTRPASGPVNDRSPSSTGTSGGIWRATARRYAPVPTDLLSPTRKQSNTMIRAGKVKKPAVPSVECHFIQRMASTGVNTKSCCQFDTGLTHWGNGADVGTSG
jgi:hypothetical protein